MTDEPVAKPWTPAPVYGVRLLEERVPDALRARPAVFTQPEPWPMVRGALDPAGGDSYVHMVETMDHAAVREATAAVARFGPTAVFGVGGGSALDHAKYTAWRLGVPLVLAPSILSVDAAYTRAIGVREGARVRYVGDARPSHLLVDFELLRAAPPRLNRAGAGDILSCYTALWDWREAAARGLDVAGEPAGYDPTIADETHGLLGRLFASAAELRDITDAGLRELSELYVGEVVLCERWGNARPEEGSEHYIAYALEARSGRSYVHGQLVGLGVVLAAAWQGQGVTPVVAFLRELGLDCGFAAVGTTRAEMRAVLLDMASYVAAERQLLPGVFHWSPVGEADVDRLLDVVDDAFA